ncbi:SAM-dependent methyltransferase [Defluviimonas sp. WL0050]|uniref:SAM-dependent methyltransferase n=1 Tax=Albidovulum litorale TaxID=2984134 RepID=A0ABT2ZTA5_9RHOB|nr:SAM-dependent methyltransferase [Defluviimonas sp. WL0050]MCV2874382.1 SAM-dependent methyltransferase [Defluviimonas sp. WL0050]
MTPLGRIIAARIAAEGPMSLSDYMAECLLNPDHGYYATRDPLGAAGDFTTAPEISQMFGEMLGLCLAQCWMDQGRPAPFLLAEIGPGRGTLMADILRTIRAVPGMADAANVHLVEASPALRAKQAETLKGHTPHWHDSIATLPDGPLYLVANEFFDALPIRQFERRIEGWAERQVGLKNDRLVPGLAPPAPAALLAHRTHDTKPGDIVEHCPALPAIAGEIASRIAAHGGVALIVDYGDWRSLGDTFQALKDHQPVDPFAEPGLADLTAHVDFQSLADAFATDATRATAMTPQGVFLERLGITARAQALARNLAGEKLESHIAAHRRLTHPEEMGQLFKAIACHPRGSAPPPGLDLA